MVAEPLERGLCEALPWLSQQEQKLLSKSLVQDFSWDDLSANSVWAFGPHANPSNLLVDFSLLMTPTLCVSEVWRSHWNKASSGLQKRGLSVVSQFATASSRLWEGSSLRSQSIDSLVRLFLQQGELAMLLFYLLSHAWWNQSLLQKFSALLTASKAFRTFC